MSDSSPHDSKSEEFEADDYELQYFGKTNDLIPVTKYRSKRTGLRIVVAQVEGPLVNGYFCLATEAHDDDGLPHTLEHLVFLGSEKYPFKGVLDLLANRCLASGTNAWTDTDHTCYTITTAGSDGFLNLLPVYLDHILYPTLTESGYITEVHHINGEGDDAGVVYCEMQARENSGESRTHLALLRAMYPGVCGYKSETGGILHNLRTSTSHAKVCDYHRTFYRPENLYLIVTGMIEPKEVLKQIHAFENKIVSKGPLTEYQQPWQSPVPPLPQSIEKVEQYPSDEEESGMILIGWRGPKAKEQERVAAIMILMEYLTDTAVAPFQRDFVEISDPFCSEVSYSILDNTESCIYLNFENVPVEKLKDIRPRAQDLLHKLASEVEPLDMSRMHIVIHRHVLESINNIELRLNQVEKFRRMYKQPQQFWIELLREYFINTNYVNIIGEPSLKLMEEMGEEEKKRIAQQVANLGETGLKKMEQQLLAAVEENEKEPPEELLTSFDVPEVSSIHFHNITPCSNHSRLPNCDHKLFPLHAIPVAFELDDIKTNFVTMSVLMNTAAVPSNLKAYLPLFLEVILESPVLRNGVLIPYEDVVKELSGDTLFSGASLGATGSKRFRCSDFGAVVSLGVRVEMDKYVQGVHWLRDLLYGVQFTVDRIRIIAHKMVNDVATMKRDGSTVSQMLLRAMLFERGSNHHISSMIRQHKFLTSVLEKINSEDGHAMVLQSLESLRTILTQPYNLKVHMAAHVEHLARHCCIASPVDVWIKEFIPTGLDFAGTRLSVPRDSEFINKNVPFDSGLIIGVGSVESSFLNQCAPCVSDYNNPDIAAIMVYMQYLTQLEGPMWKQIRGQGLSYHYRMFMKLDSGLIYFLLHKSSQLIEAYQEAKKIVMELIDGSHEINEVELIAAKSSLIFSIIEEEESPSDASMQSLLSYFRGIDHGYNRKIIESIPKVTVEDLKRVGVEYCAPLFDPSRSKVAICCHPTKVEEIRKEMSNRFGRHLKVVNSMDDEFLSEM